MRKTNSALLVLGLSIAIFSGCARMQVSRANQSQSQSQSQTLADILAVCARGSVAFRDSGSAQDMLAGLSSSDVVYGVVLMQDKSVLAEYSKDKSKSSDGRMLSVIRQALPEGESCCTNESKENSNSPLVFAPIKAGVETIGYVALATRDL